MLVLSTFMMNHMLKEYRNSLAQNYEQAAIHISSSVENMLSVYNNASKSVYSYEPGSQKQGMDYSSGFDNVRQILTGEIYDPQERSSQRESEMRLFLQNIENMDGYLYAVHFLADSEETGKLTFHFSRRNTFFNNEDKFYQAMDYGNWDKTSKNLLLVPTHKADYYNGMSSDVFTVARNYFDIRGEIGREKYIGTLFQDIDIEKLRLISKKVHIDGAQSIWLLNGQGDCFFSTDEEQIGRNLVREGLLPADSKDTMVISTGENGYGLKVVIAVDTREAFGRISSIQVTMYLFLAICAAALLLASIYFSRKLTQPIHNMMEQMSQVESGNFDIQLCAGKSFACSIDDSCADDTVRHFGNLSARSSGKHTAYYRKTISYAGQRSDKYGKHPCGTAGADNRRRSVRRVRYNAHSVYKHRLLCFFGSYGSFHTYPL